MCCTRMSLGELRLSDINTPQKSVLGDYLPDAPGVSKFFLQKRKKWDRDSEREDWDFIVYGLQFLFGVTEF